MTKNNQFDVKKLRTNFLAKAKRRIRAQEKGDSKFTNDAGYWRGGRCQWGGSHNLNEDCQTLANFFNSVADIDNDINEIKLSANEQIFHQNKQALILKIESLIKKCQLSSATSVANVCIIWNDFFGICLERFLKTFTRKLTRHLNAIEKLEPKHQQELLDLEAQARAAKSEYEENLKKANDPNLSEEEKAQFIALANKAAKQAESLKKKIRHNPLVQIGQFNYLDDLRMLSEGDVPENVTPDRKQSLGDEPDSVDLPGNNIIPNPLEDPQEFISKYRNHIFFALVALALAFFIYTQKEEEEANEATKEDKKFLRQMALLKAMKDKV